MTLRTAAGSDGRHAARRPCARQSDGESASSQSVSRRAARAPRRPRAGRAPDARLPAAAAARRASRERTFEQVEQGLLRPMQILDQHDRRSVSRELVQEGDPRPAQPLARNERMEVAGASSPSVMPSRSCCPAVGALSPADRSRVRPRCSSNDLAEWQVRDPRPVRDAAAGCAATAAGRCEPSHSQSSRSSVVFPIPASPMIVTRRGWPLRPRGRRPVAEPRAPARGRRRRAAARRRRAASSASARGRDGGRRLPSGFPLAATVAGSSNSKAPSTAATVRSPTRISPGPAACSSRAATLTASPSLCTCMKRAPVSEPRPPKAAHGVVPSITAYGPRPSHTPQTRCHSTSGAATQVGGGDSYSSAASV